MPGRAEGVDAAVAERRRPARTGAAIRLPEADRVAMPPHRLAGRDLVAGDDLVVSALFLRVEEIAVDGERRPARPDRPAPHLDRRRCRPVGVDPHAANDAVALGSAKAGPLRGAIRGGDSEPRGVSPGCSRGRRGLAPRASARLVGAGSVGASGGAAERRRRLRLGTRRARGGSSSALSQQPFLGGRRPPPVIVRTAAGDAVGPHQRPDAAREQDGRRPADARRAPIGDRRVATAHATRARLSHGIGMM